MEKLTGLTIDEIKIGDEAKLIRRVSEADVGMFAEATGDRNPVHLDETFAAGTMFKGRIAHGMLGAGLISSVIGMRLPGPGAIYVGQELKFTKPIYLGDTVTVVCTVAECNREKNRIVLETRIINQNDETVVEGKAKIMPSKTKIQY